MDYRERFAGPQEALRLAMIGKQAGMWTALPGIFVSFNTEKAGSITAVVQPALQGVTQVQDGTYTNKNLPILQDVPVVFPHGGGCSLTFPLKAGDECLVIFSSRCIDSWWQSGGIDIPMEPRMHDLSDGFAIPGPYSQPKVIANVSATRAQFRTDDGQTIVEIDPASHLLNLTTTGNITAHADGTGTITTGGNLSAVVGGTTTLNSSGAVTVTAPTATFNAATVTINGNLIVNGGISGTTSGGGTGSATFAGSITAQGTITGVTDVIAGGKSGKNHVHSGVQPGGSSTNPPT